MTLAKTILLRILHTMTEQQNKDPLSDPSLRVSRSDPRQMKLFDQHLVAHPKQAAVLSVCMALLGLAVGSGYADPSQTQPRRWFPALLAFLVSAWCLSGSLRGIRSRTT